MEGLFMETEGSINSKFELETVNRVLDIDEEEPIDAEMFKILGGFSTFLDNNKHSKVVKGTIEIFNKLSYFSQYLFYKLDSKGRLKCVKNGELMEPYDCEWDKHFAVNFLACFLYYITDESRKSEMTIRVENGGTDVYFYRIVSDGNVKKLKFGHNDLYELPEFVESTSPVYDAEEMIIDMSTEEEQELAIKMIVEDYMTDDNLREKLLPYMRRKLEKIMNVPQAKE